MIGSLIKGALGAVVKPATDAVQAWQDRKTLKLKQELALSNAKVKAKIRLLENGQANDFAWEKMSIGNSSWKDEYFTVVLSIPLILCFVPSMVPYIMEGFKALKTTPQWYQWAVLVAISSSFGYKKLADFMALKKGV